MDRKEVIRRPATMRPRPRMPSHRSNPIEEPEHVSRTTIVNEMRPRNDVFQVTGIHVIPHDNLPAVWICLTTTDGSVRYFMQVRDAKRLIDGVSREVSRYDHIDERC